MSIGNPHDVLAVGYARVSTRNEDINNQKHLLKSYAEQKGYLLIKIFEDTDVSGAMETIERPSFRRMIEFCTEANIRIIIVQDISRLGRSLLDCFQTIKWLYDRGYKVVLAAHDLVIDPEKMEHKLIIMGLALAAEFERESMHRRMEAARAAGKRIGRPPVDVPVKEVEKYLKLGLTKKDVYNLLVAKGYLRYKERGEERVLSYHQFLRRLKALGL